MATIVKKIGTTANGCAGGVCDYTSLQAWHDAMPANLVTDGNSQEGDCYSDNEFTGTTRLLLVSGKTTDATHTILLTTAPGQGFRDNVNVQTNALDYNAANGAAITSSVGSSTTIAVSGVQFFTISNLQVKATGSYGFAFNSEAVTNITIDDCIMENSSTAGNRVVSMSSSSKIRNTAVIQKKSGALSLVGGSVSTGTGGPNCFNCTFVAITGLAAKPSEVIDSFYLTVTVENCALFGCTAVKAGSSTVTFTSCMTDVVSPPTGCTTVTYANQFQSTTNDFRLKSGADCINAGTTDSTNAATDIVGTSRPQGSAYDIGCWEFISAAAAIAVQQLIITKQSLIRAAFW